MSDIEDLNRELAISLQEVFADANRLSRLAEYVFGISQQKQTAGDLVVKAAEDGVVGELYAAALLLSGNDPRLLRLKETVNRVYSGVLQRRLSKRNRFLDGWQLTEGIHRVCRVEIEGQAIGSGFLLAADLIITNYHVLRSKFENGQFNSRGIVFRFDCRKKQIDGKDGVAYVPVVEAPLVASSAVTSLDYLLVRVAGDPGVAPRGWFAVSDFGLNLDLCDYAYVIQHPDGNPVQVADGPIASRFVLRDRSRVLYSVDTEGGSSGSPCVQRDGKLLALHCGTEEGGNQGVFFPAIARHIKESSKGQIDLLSNSPSGESPNSTVVPPPILSGDELESGSDTKSPAHWTASAGNDGRWYKPDPAVPNYRAEMLVVLVHGFLGDCVKTWDDVHFTLHRELELTCDVFSYDYPAGLTEDADIQTAGKQLRTVIQPELEKYQHLLVLAHSAGGLVVKQWLCEDADRLEEEILARSEGRSAISIRDLRYAILSVRQIVNFDVPHAGGDAWKTWLGHAAYDFVIWPALKVCNIFGIGFGYNKIVNQLRYLGEFVTRLEYRYVAIVQSLENAALPRPVSVEFLASADSAIAIAPYIDAEKVRSDIDSKHAWVRSDADSVEFRRTHTTVQRFVERFDVVLRHLQHHLARWKDAIALSVAAETLCRADEFLLEFRCRRPFGVAVEDRSGPQAAVSKTLESFILSPRQSPARAVVTGGANVGKSVLARFLIRDFCLRYLRVSSKPEFLPLFFPMQLLPVDTSKVASVFQGNMRLDAWNMLLKAWCEFAEDLISGERSRRRLPGLSIVSEWVLPHLHQSPCLLVFDSVDEFFDKHRNVIEVADLRRTIDAAISDPVGAGLNHSFRLVQFVRETLPDCETLAPPLFRFVLRPPTEVEANDMFPGLKGELERVPERLRTVVISPLLLPTLARHLGEISDERLNSESAIYTEALLWLIRDSMLLANYPDVSERQFFDAIAAIAWDYYVTRDYVLPFRIIQSRLVARIQEWTHPAQGPTQQAQARRAQLSHLMSVVTATDVMQSLLQKTIFVKVSDHPTLNSSRQMGYTYRIQHENWIQQLGAHYLTDCIRALQPTELSFGACTSYMFAMAGEILIDTDVTADVVTIFLGSQQKSPYVAGNFISTFAGSEMRIDASAAALMVQNPAALPGIAQVVLVSGLGWRILRNSKTDKGLENLRRHVLPALHEILGAPEKVAACSVTRSLAWCILRQLGEKDVGPRPVLWDGHIGEEDDVAKGLVCDPTTSPPTITAAHRSLQRAFIEIQDTDKDDVARPISLVHYLYFLALAYKVNGATESVDTCLRKSDVLAKYTSSSDGIVGGVADACRNLAGLAPATLAVTE